MRHRRLDRYNAAVALAPLGAIALVAAVSSTVVPRRVQVVARDYAFEAPDTLPAGVVSFELENRGAHDHELIIGRLRPGRDRSGHRRRPPAGRALAAVTAGVLGRGRRGSPPCAAGHAFASKARRAPRAWASVCTVLPAA